MCSLISSREDIMKSIKKLFLTLFVSTSLFAGESILDEIEKTKKLKVCVCLSTMEYHF